MVSYHDFSSDHIEQALDLYKSEGWSLYFGDITKLIRAFDNSLYILGAFEGDKLIGFIRCIGDGEYDLYVSDLIVDKEYRRKGIGTALLRKAMERYADVDTFALMTGINEEMNNAFYRAMGMKEYREKGLLGYLR